MKTLISQLGEKQLIKRLIDKKNTQLNINTDSLIFKSYVDDAALQLNTSKYTVLSMDMLIQKSHFPKNMTPFQIGEKIVTVNVSDILSMNAKAQSILISMALPSNMTLDDFDNLVDGILYKCKEYEVILIGGDINQADEIILSATATGVIDDNIKFQSDIKEDELVAVTGLLGSPAAALDIINHDLMVDIEDKEEIVNTLLEPNLPIDTINKLREYPNLVTSMTDITDGLARELFNLKEKNENIGFEIYKNQIPYNKSIEVVANENNTSLNEYLFHFGEEFEMLLTINHDEYEKYKNNLNDIYIIGKTNRTNEIVLIDKDNKEVLNDRGYEHLRGDKDEYM